MSCSLHQFLPVSLNLSRSIRSLIVVVFSHLHSILGPSPRRHPSWKPRSRRHDWKIFLGYGPGTRSRSCWTCKGTSRHNFHSFLVDNGWYHADRWVPSSHYTLVSDCFNRIHTRQRRLVTSISPETLPSRRSAWPNYGMIGVMLCMMRNGLGHTLCVLDDSARDGPSEHIRRAVDRSHLTLLVNRVSRTIIPGYKE